MKSTTDYIVRNVESCEELGCFKTLSEAREFWKKLPLNDRVAIIKTTHTVSNEIITCHV